MRLTLSPCAIPIASFTHAAIIPKCNIMAAVTPKEYAELNGPISWMTYPTFIGILIIFHCCLFAATQYKAHTYVHYLYSYSYDHAWEEEYYLLDMHFLYLYSLGALFCYVIYKFPEYCHAPCLFIV